MLHGTVWDTPSASSKKEVSFKPETELGYITSNCMGHAVRQFEKDDDDDADDDNDDDTFIKVSKL